jgi:hypothetical protein
MSQQHQNPRTMLLSRPGLYIGHVIRPSTYANDVKVASRLEPTSKCMVMCFFWCVSQIPSKLQAKCHLHQSKVNQNEVLTLHERSLLLPRAATTMWSPASGCRLLPPPLIILPPPRQVWVTTATTTMKRTSRRRKRGRTPMGEDYDDPTTAWHPIGGSWHHPTPTPMVVGQRHRTSDKRGRGGGGFHIQQSTKNRQQ